MAFPISPGVSIREIDLTTGTPAVATSIAAAVGQFVWGPADDITLVTSEPNLKARFGAPNEDTYVHYYAAANFLSYSNNLRLVRVVADDAMNATTDGGGRLIKNADSYIDLDPDQGGNLDSTPNRFWAAKFPGSLGNSLGIAMCPADTPALEMTGTVEIVSGVCTGTGTAFDDELFVGAKVSVNGNVFHVASITSNTQCDFTYPLADQAAGSAPTRLIHSNFEDFNMVGTVSLTANSLEVVGTGTAFTADFKVGDLIVVGANTSEVQSIASDVSMTIKHPISTSAIAGGTSYDKRWKFALNFDSAPGTSAHAETANAQNDEIHVVVYDYAADWTEVEDDVIESWSNLSVGRDAKSPEGASIYYKQRINNTSQYVSWLNHPNEAMAAATGDWGGYTKNARFTTVKQNYYYEMTGGSDGGAITVGDMQLGWDKFNDPNVIEISIMMLGAPPEGDGATLANYITGIAGKRKDCVVCISPEFSDVVNKPNAELSNLKNFRTSLTSSTYSILDTGWGYQYDKYNDTYRWIPLNGDIAGILARTDADADTWFSPAGFQRGTINSAIRLAYNPTQEERDELYRIGYNPVVSFPGQGTVLFGDKTLSAKPSAFDRINVRRLFIYCEKVIGQAARDQLFQFNTAFTRSNFSSLIEGFLEGIKSGQGITDFLVVCDETNNTPDLIDANKFAADIFIKPTKSINFIQLTFVAVRSGVEFSEAVGAV